MWSQAGWSVVPGPIGSKKGYLGTYTVSQKKNCGKLSFAPSLSVKYDPISIKVGRIVPE